jgi:hypothetical protein
MQRAEGANAGAVSCRGNCPKRKRISGCSRARRREVSSFFFFFFFFFFFYVSLPNPKTLNAKP